MLSLEINAAQRNAPRPATAPDAEADRELVRAALEGAPAALQALVTRLTPVIKARVARSLYRNHAGGQQQEVTDLTQDVFMKLLADRGRALRAWDPERGLMLDGFVRLIAERQVASILRSKRRASFERDLCDPNVLDEQPLSNVRSLDSEIAGRERFERLLVRVAAQLTPRAHELFRRLFVEMQAPAEVALELSLSLDAVYQWRSRLVKTVRSTIAAAGPESTCDSARRSQKSSGRS